MTDGFGRTIDYLRLSITDRCNLRCRYCMPEEVPFVPHNDILHYEEMVRVCAAAARLGVDTIKVTGGEPLARKGCADLVAALKAVPGIRRVTLTTNGVLLAQQLPGLLAAGLDGINVSLDTLDREIYRHLTGRDELPRALAGLDASLTSGVRTKVNAVPLAETGREGLLALAALAETRLVDVRFIELMPVGHGTDLVPFGQEALLAALKERWPGLTPTAEKRGNGPARYWIAPELKGAIGFISAVSHEFCEHCNRVRLTSEGFLKLCLCYGDGVDLRSPLRGGASDGELEALLRQAILQKPAHHSFGEGRAQEGRIMSQIGG
ncbi:MAG: GTP 3',8-cyclase MoaA [Pseudoflavonifractor sp.]|nr:GTP 3',8-cyclase MoaA [Pseudoflavonifractor sp.]